ncbi:sensor histidine kinase [Brachybacterium phenoliresistens]|uniref:sensor histidine kinase n=1 Tax=Brachybacterium phenoliresistens TaxID=396014 RepID=UPI0012EC2D02|nr:hypothetical protein [Brachybacterium phenoliresistens]
MIPSLRPQDSAPWWRRLLAFLIGPRFIDPPLRFVTVFFGTMTILPTGFDPAGGPGYVALSVIAGLLVIVSAFLPRLTLVAGILGTFAFMGVDPDLVNPFNLDVLVAAGVLLTYRRYRLWAVAVAGLALEVLVGRMVGASSGSASDAQVTLLVAVLVSVLGLGAGLGEARIQAEIARREDAVRRHEHELSRLRIQVAIDTHDTVSHGLATQAAIIRVLGQEAAAGRGPDVRTLSELGMVNDRSQRQLRQLLSRLRGDDEQDRSTDLSEALKSVTGAITAGAVAGGFALDVRFGALPPAVPAPVVDAAQKLLTELATNVFKHARTDAPCVITVEVIPGEGGSALQLASHNAVASPSGFTPRTLTRRAELLGGSCEVRRPDGDSAEVLVRIPLPADGAPVPAVPPGISAEDLLRADEAPPLAHAVESS